MPGLQSPGQSAALAEAAGRRPWAERGHRISLHVVAANTSRTVQYAATALRDIVLAPMMTLRGYGLFLLHGEEEAATGMAAPFLELAIDAHKAAGSLVDGFYGAVKQVAAPTARRCAGLPLAQLCHHRSISEAGPPLGVGLSMSVIYFSFVLTCVPSHLWEEAATNGLWMLCRRAMLPFHKVVWLGLFHVSFLLAAAAYLQGVVTDPGGIPHSWREGPGVNEQVLSRIQERKRSSGALRFCTKEQAFKPDRAHFCRGMGRNVLRMDHYCPWLCNCVGYFNHKFFLQCMLYSVTCSNMTIWSLCQALASRSFPLAVQPLLIGCSLLCIVLSLVLTPFLLFHLWLLSKNLTTIEYCEHRYKPTRYGASPYDLGLLQNVRSVLGENVLLWFLPIGTPSGDGITWEQQPLEEDPATSLRVADERVL